MEASTMRNLVGVLAIVLTLLLITAGSTQAGENLNTKKYGIEFKLGGGFYAMQDVNDFIPHPDFINPAIMGADEKTIHIGTQLGIGFSYRSQENYGWLFGFNSLAAGVPVVMTEKYRTNAFFPGGLGAESWAEQTVSGWELYITPVWYFTWKDLDLDFQIGPAIYRASLDRSISIINSEGGANPSGSFDDANGTALGFIIAAGLELPLSETYFLNIRLGGRFANVGELIYENNQGTEESVYKNSASNSTLGVDFSGAFLTLGIRTYFLPSSDWRTPGK
jgi:hypothetical protein